MSIRKEIKKAKIIAKKAALKLAMTGVMLFGANETNANNSSDHKETIKEYKEYLTTFDNNTPLIKDINNDPAAFLIGLEIFEENGAPKGGSDVASFMNLLEEIKKDSPKTYKEVTKNLDNLAVGFLTYSQEIEQKKLAQKAISKAPKDTGYDSGSYSVSYAINKEGDISKLKMTSSKANNTKNLKTINEAIARQNNFAVDRTGAMMDASEYITKMLIREDVLSKMQQGQTVSNGEAFLKKFDKDIKENGMFINKEGKLQSTAENLKKPLKTKSQLEAEYIKSQEIAMKQFMDGYNR